MRIVLYNGPELMTIVNERGLPGALRYIGSKLEESHHVILTDRVELELTLIEFQPKTLEEHANEPESPDVGSG